ncbi:aminodeoxychorismate/anthranilate synthase component II [Fimbriimonadia bacterium ATM]|nr:MAG: aminodeoxychorismate/anthranilate synthase component II [Armatimonadota bacterium]MBC6969456.1 aminodeoxychorismate/anthranilate synthase component II [Armatimonadota bacterium]MCE7899206.1 aminodeoxychorismate/anthranilate synthase component II [Armatimonadetes bacterium ATM1]MDL1928989.1 aminodeoxychorismate/anthranilate synthase component II [Fimbriimonadia bacterium ATM]RIJ97271.1 MAG: anthranilate/aminodeoxychorismate synthase component II [Armatimonadota bacterium]
MILILDNYDSFTYNLAQYVQELGAEVVVRRNDDITVEEIEAMAPQGILISPGPCTPDKAGISEEVIQRLGGRIPIFGVCLGMQAIGEVYGGKIVRAKQIMHGKDSEIRHEGKGVFQGLPSRFRAIRYHSLVIEPSSVPSELEVTATSEDGEIMGVRHRGLDVEGVQFHPESALSESGKELVANWVRRVTSR